MIIHPDDNVEVRSDGHKYAVRAIRCGEWVIKYGMPIGRAVADIAVGEHVHTHNLKTGLAGQLTYEYHPSEAVAAFERIASDRTFAGYLRRDGQTGIRNELWVIPTVGCVNRLAERLAQAVGGVALTHPFGCSQLGDDHERTAQLLTSLVRNPNAGGVLVVGLGCENNTLESFQVRLGDVSLLNLRVLQAQEERDEFAAGLRLLEQLENEKVKVRRERPLSELRVGLKCGGSDGFSGLTANPLLGRFTDWLVARGGSCVLTEVPEMFGAETLLLNRCVNREVFTRCAAMVNGFKAYYESHGQPVYENPSPGNKAGGISTLEDKSLGCVQKGGGAPVVDVLEYGERLKSTGLSLLSAPGNDPVASTALAAAGCQLLLFTTGRGTPFGTVVPTVKIASNSTLAERKPHWIDWDAMACPEVDDFVDFLLRLASGEVAAKNEINGDRGIAIFKDGVTL